ncbi:MAG: alpha/beta hydrolase [Pseudomonadota bacterium]
MLGQHFHLVAVNRPGFGLSDGVPLQPDLGTQARYVAPLLTYGSHSSPAIVAGHSLGGTIAYQLAVDYPDHVGAILPIAANIDPKEGQPRWFNRLASLPIIRWLVPGDLAKANVEIMPLSGELKALLPQLSNIKMPVTVIHGGNDKLVSVKNLVFVQQHLQGADLHIIEQPDAGHFILWEQPDIVVSAAIQLLDRVTTSTGLLEPQAPKDSEIMAP